MTVSVRRSQMMNYDNLRLMKTFYIATRFDNREAALALGRRFEALGMTWFRGHNWAERVGVTPIDHPMAPQLAQAEIEAAAFADIFVKLLTPERSPGAFGELGARLAVGRIVHLIADEQRLHLFHRHPNVRCYRDESHFWERLSRFLRGDTRYVWPEDDIKQRLYSSEPY